MLKSNQMTKNHNDQPVTYGLFKKELKKELKHFEKRMDKKMDKRFAVFETRINERFAAQEIHLELRLEEFKDEIDTKAQERHSQIMNLVDGLALEIRDNREFRVIITEQVQRADKKIEILKKSLIEHKSDKQAHHLTTTCCH